MTINIRFVPKGKSDLGIEALSSMPAERMIDFVAPTPAEMRKGMVKLSERKMYSEPSAQNRLSANIAREEFNEMFPGIDLKTETVSRERSISDKYEYLAPDRELEVPNLLKDVFAFAYMPRPVEFFAPQAVPPHEDIYHLELSDVALALNAPRCHRNGNTGKGVKVAMADSGFWLHPFFIRSGYKLVPTESPGSGDPSIDPSGHGTGEAANIFAVAPDCTVFGVKHGSSAAGTLETCIDLNPDVMTNSWGWNVDTVSRDQLRQSNPNFFRELVDIESVIQSAVDKGICVLFSAGNGHFAFPASFPAIIAAGGVTLNEDGSLEASSYASGFESQLYPGRNVPDVSGLVGRSEPAPQSAHIMLPVPPNSELDGENFPSAVKETGWGIFSGTSAASPQLAGIVALMKQSNKSLDTDQIRQILRARAVDVIDGQSATGAPAGPGEDLATGSGLADALRSCGFTATA